MNKIIGLPKKALIVCIDGDDLIIENNEIQYIYGLLEWCIDIIANKDHWDNVLSQMISQGLRLDAVIEQCIEDLKNRFRFQRMLSLFIKEKCTYQQRCNYTDSPAGKQLAADFEKRLCAIKSWDQFRDLLSWTGDYQNKMKDKVLKEVLACKK